MEWKHLISFVATIKGGQTVESALTSMQQKTVQVSARATQALTTLDQMHQRVGSTVGRVSQVMSTSVANSMNAQGRAIKTTTALWKDSQGAVNQTRFSMIRSTGAWHTLNNTIKVTPGHLAKTSQGFRQMIGLAMRSAAVVPIWFLIRQTFMAFINLIKNSVKFLIDWEYQMAQLRIVARGSKEDYDRLGDSLLKLARAYGSSIKDLGVGAKLWAQQGKAIGEIIPLMETTIRLSLLTGRSVSDSVEDLTAIMKSFKLEATETDQVVDKLTKVMLNHAVTTDVLVAALKQVAPVATQVGVSFESLLGIITATAVATRQSGSRIGRAWRTIFSRMTTTAQTAIQSLGKIPVFLDEFGEATFKQTDTLRDLDEVLLDLTVSWNTFGSATQAQLRKAIAGIRRGTEFASAMNQMEEGIDATIESLDAYGEGQKAVNVLLDTAKKKADQVKISWNLLINEIADTRGIKSALDGLNNFIEGLRQISIIRERGFSELETTVALEQQEEANKANLENVTKQVTKTEDLIKKTTLLQKLVKSREFAEQRGLTDRLSNIDKLIEKFTVGFGRVPLFADLVDVGFEDLSQKLEEKQKTLADSLIGQKVLQDVSKQMGQIGSVVSNEWEDILKRNNEFVRGLGKSAAFGKRLQISPFKGFTAGIIPTTAEISELENILKMYRFTLEEAQKKGGGFFVEKDDIPAMKAQVAGLEKIVKLRKQGEQITSNIDKRIVLEKESAKFAEEDAKKRVITNEELKRQFKLLGNLKNLGISDLEIAERKLKTFQDLSQNLEEVDEKQARSLQASVDALRIQEQYRNIFLDINTIAQQMSLEGFSQLEIETQRLALLEKIGAGEKNILNQRKKVQQLAVQELKQRQGQLADLFVQFEKAEGPEKERIRRVLELINLSADELESKFKRDVFDRQVILQYWSQFSDEAKKSIAGVIGEQNKLAGRDLLDDRINIAREVRDAFDVNVADAFATTWEHSMMGALERFKEAFQSILSPTDELAEQNKLFAPEEEIAKPTAKPIREIAPGVFTTDDGPLFQSQSPQGAIDPRLKQAQIPVRGDTKINIAGINVNVKGGDIDEIKEAIKNEIDRELDKPSVQRKIAKAVSPDITV